MYQCVNITTLTNCIVRHHILVEQTRRVLQNWQKQAKMESYTSFVQVLGATLQ